MTYLKTPKLTPISDVIAKRDEIKRYFSQTFDLYEELFLLLKDDEAFYQRPEKLRHPLIFYFGHTATFFTNKLVLAKILPERINPNFESMFAIGVDEMSWDDLNERNYTWPKVSEVRAYRKVVKEKILNLIDELPLEKAIDWNSPWWPIMMGIEHENIHIETSSVLIRQLDTQFIRQNSKWQHYEPQDAASLSNELVPVPQGKVKLGKDFSHHLYGWDNEYGEYEEEVQSFKAAKFVTSNREFLEFVEEGGYKNDRFWSEEGASWKRYTKAVHPIFWKKSESGYLYRTLTDWIPLPLSFPVDVNFHEAKAFCNWLSEKSGKNIRMPTETEWQRIFELSGITEECFTNIGNINLSVAASSTPVNLFQHGPFYDVIGNVWQWCETPIVPFHGFKVHPLYDDFTTPTFDNKHNMIKGGSWISLGNEATKYSRYAFRRHFFQHAGFRYVESEVVIKVNDYNYESDTQVSQYSEFHYGDKFFGVENFAKKIAEVAIDVTNGKKQERALDLGCATGRTAFELAKKFMHVDGVDFSARFINAAVQLQSRGELRYYLKDEGDLTSFYVRNLSEFSFASHKDRVHFSQGDAMNLKPIYTDYDLIIMCNLIDRLRSPKEVLGNIHQRLRIGGTLLIASPFTWMEEYTKKEEWPGGFKEANGEILTTTEALNRILATNFKRVRDPFEIEFVIRETKRKFQHTLSEVNIFERVK